MPKKAPTKRPVPQPAAQRADKNVNVSKQTAGGVTGAVVGAAVAGPLGAVVGGATGAMIGEESAKGKQPVKRAVAAIRSEISEMHPLEKLKSAAGKIKSFVSARKKKKAATKKKAMSKPAATAKKSKSKPAKKKKKAAKKSKGARARKSASASTAPDVGFVPRPPRFGRKRLVNGHSDPRSGSVCVKPQRPVIPRYSEESSRPLKVPRRNRRELTCDRRLQPG